MATAELTRRLFLRNTGAATIVGSAVTAPAVVEAAIASDTLSRVRHHWEQFARAMDDLTAGHGHGWVVSGFTRLPFEKIDGGRGLQSRLVRYGMEQPHPRVVMPVERHHEIIGLQLAADQWRDEATAWEERALRL